MIPSSLTKIGHVSRGYSRADFVLRF